MSRQGCLATSVKSLSPPGLWLDTHGAEYESPELHMVWSHTESKEFSVT